MLRLFFFYGFQRKIFRKEVAARAERDLYCPLPDHTKMLTEGQQIKNKWEAIQRCITTLNNPKCD